MWGQHRGGGDGAHRVAPDEGRCGFPCQGYLQCHHGYGDGCEAGVGGYERAHRGGIEPWLSCGTGWAGHAEHGVEQSQGHDTAHGQGGAHQWHPLPSRQELGLAPGRCEVPRGGSASQAAHRGRTRGGVARILHHSRGYPCARVGPHRTLCGEHGLSQTQGLRGAGQVGTGAEEQPLLSLGGGVAD